MNEHNLKAPIPLKNRRIAELSTTEMKLTRSSSSSDDLSTKRAKLFNNLTNDCAPSGIPRPRSATPVLSERTGGLQTEDLVQQRLKYYNLDYVSDAEKHEQHIYDPNSKWFSRKEKLKMPFEKQLPYTTESHKEQAKYLCHILVNLYIGISTLDIQGLITITSKDLADFRKDIDELALNTDMFRLAAEEDLEVNDITNFDEDDEDEDDSQDYDGNDYDLGGPDFGPSGKITAKSSSVINVNHWTNELKNCLHFDFPLSVRKSLAVVYYHLSLVQGQKIYRQMHINMFESLVTDDDMGTNFRELLLEHGLKLDYKPMLAFLTEFLPCPESDYVRYDITSKADLQLFRLLLKLAHESKMFYDKEDRELLQNTMDRFIASFSPHTLSCVLPIITSFVPYHYQEDRNVIDYFPFMFNIWSSTSASMVFDTHLYDFTGCVAEDAYLSLIKEKSPRLVRLSGISFGPYGIFTEEQMDFILNRIQNHLRDDYQIHSYSRTVRPLIYSINGSYADQFFGNLSFLIKSIETFVHPSNSGQWTKVIAKFVHGLIKMYHERWVKEKKLTETGFRKELWLTPKCNEQMVDLFLDVLVLGSQNKDTDMANYYISSFAYLLDINPSNSHKIYDRVLIDLYDSLTDQYIHSVHRVITSLKQFTRIVRYMVIHPLYRVHISNILTMLISKIGSNDISLTSNTINALVSIFTFIPLENFVKEDEYLTFASQTVAFIQEHIFFLKDGGSSQDFKYDTETLDNAFRASTTEFENILKIYVDKLVELVDSDLEEGLITKINQTTMIMMESMPDSMFKHCCQLISKSFWNLDVFSESSPNYELLTIPMGAAVRRDNSLSKKWFMDLSYNIRDQISRGAGSIRSSSEVQRRDLKLVSYLSALNDITRQSHEAMLQYKDEFVDLLKFIQNTITNPPLDVITSMVLHCALSSLTSIEVTECRLFPEDSKISNSDRWGGLQFDDRKYNDENTNFNWHVPCSEEVDFAIYLLESFSEDYMKKITAMMENPNKESAYVDELKKCLLNITHSLSGASLLFDPDFNKEKSDPQLMDPYKKKFLLLKQLREQNCDNQEIRLDIEQIRHESQDDDGDESAESLANQELAEDVNDEMPVMEDPPIEDTEIPDIENISGVPSVVATPAPGSHFEDGTSAMNSAIVFRDLELFTCRYYFGNTTEEKLSDNRYIRVHAIRAKIGKFFHTLFKFLKTNFTDNPGVFQILLHGMKVWFTDVGQETIFKDDPSSFLDLEFLENIQSLAHSVSDPVTRTYLAADVHSHHDARVLLRSTNRVPSKLESTLLRDVIDLAISVYPDIHKPAQGCMVHAMKQLLGSYSLTITKIIKELRQALEKEEYRNVEVLLEVLFMKKIHRKLMSDYKNLGDLISLLLQACKVNDLDVAVYADKLLNSIATSFKIPSSVCVINLDEIQALSPNDSFIDIQIDVVRKAKANKRDYYYSLLSAIQDSLLAYLNENAELGWKIPVFIVKFISRIQGSLEFSANSRVLEEVFALTKTKHPVIIHLAISNIVAISSKILSIGDYDYDISNAFRSDFRRRYIELLDTTEPGFAKKFRDEMSNFDSSTYYIDALGYIGWMAWGIPLPVVKNVDQIDLHLRPEDFEVLKNFGNRVSLPWLQELATLLIQDNESRGMFSNSNVSFFSLLCRLISNDICGVTYDQLLQLCLSLYDKNDKASMIMSIEIFAGLMTAAKFTTVEDLQKRDKFLDEFLSYCLDRELNQDSVDIWNMVCWWLPTYVDIRRLRPLFMKLLQGGTELDINSDSSANQASKLTLLRSMLIMLEYKAPDLEDIFVNLVFDHPYDQVRQEVARLMSALIQARISPSFESVDQLLASSRDRHLKRLPDSYETHICRLFDAIEQERRSLDNLTPQQVLRTKYYYMASTMLYWIAHIMKSPNQLVLVPLVSKHIAPFLLNLQKMRDTCKLAGISPASFYVSLSYTPLRRDEVPAFVGLLEKTDLTSSNELRTQLYFAENLYSHHMLCMGQRDRDRILDFVIACLFNENYVEVRTRAADVLSGIVHNLTDPACLPRLIDMFQRRLGAFDPAVHRKGTAASHPRIHGSIIGLGAVVSAFPYAFPLPHWIPEQLSLLSAWTRAAGVSGTAAKDVISNFKKVRADTWHLDRYTFAPEQLEDLEGVLWRSYYA
ncbi:FAGL022Wp [Eremothecium gossypii FDAG1]|nr:FAGL022Wp [Eremothecium gossypii FDAG1]